MKKILVVNVNWMGDVIFSSPVFKALRSAYPQAHIACMAVPRVVEILECVDEIDEIIVYDEKGRHKNPFAKLGLIWELMQKRFDVAFLLHGSLTRALLVFLAGIKERVGYDTKKRGCFLTHKVAPLKGLAHRCDYYLNVIESYGVVVPQRLIALNVPAQENEYAKNLFQDKGIKEDDFSVALHLGGNWDLKRWPLANFEKLVDRLIGDFKARVIIIGGSDDVKLAQEVGSHCRHAPTVVAGETTLKQLMAILQNVKLVISSDSGPLHLANSVSTDIIGLFGPTRPEITGPRGVGRAFVRQHGVGCNEEPCYYLQCPDNICMQAITVEEVCHVVRQIKN